MLRQVADDFNILRVTFFLKDSQHMTLLSFFLEENFNSLINKYIVYKRKTYERLESYGMNR